MAGSSINSSIQYVEKILQQADPDDSGQAINFITYDQDKGFQVSPEAQELLTSDELVNSKIGIVAVAGKYRTGKSFLLNRILLNKTGNQAGFNVGPTINPCTKGLWLWNKPFEIKAENGDESSSYKVLIVDSEGIGAFNEDENHDTRIFLLALLLSSYFIYNSMGTIDENALQNLSLIVNLSKQLEVKGQKAEDEDPDTVSQYFPSFLWVVRDFSLRLQDEFKNVISSRQYLENALKEQKGTSDAVEKKNKIRRLINNYFKEKDCFTMVRPTEDEKDLQNVQNLYDCQLRKEFITQMQILRGKVFKKVRPKRMNGRHLTGQMFLELCQSYTQAINQGSVPNINSAWSNLCRNENMRAIEAAIRQYQDRIQNESIVYDNVLKKSIQSIELSKLKVLNKAIKSEVLQEFQDKAFGEETQEGLDKITKQIEDFYSNFKHKLTKNLQSRLNKQIESKSQEIEQDIRNAKFKNIHSLVEAIKELRSNLIAETEQIQFKDKQVLIYQETERLLIKGFEHIWRNNEVSNNLLQRQLEERTKYFETQINQSNQDNDTKETELKEKLLATELQLSQVLAKQKIQEQLFEDLKEKKEELQLQLNEQLQQIESEKGKVDETLKSKNQELMGRLSLLEEENSKLLTYKEKNEALNQQKLEFQSYIQKQFVEKENKEQSERMHQIQNENEQRKKDIEKLKQQYDSKLKEIIKLNKSQFLDKEKKWNEEKRNLHQTLELTKQQIEENRKMHQQLMAAINEKRSAKNTEVNHQCTASSMEFNNNTHNTSVSSKFSMKQNEQEINELKEQLKQVQEANRMLSETIGKQETRNNEINAKLQKYKTYSKCFKHSMSSQCKFCHSFYPTEIFLDHAKTCSKDLNNFSRSHFFQIRLDCHINDTLLLEDPSDHRTYSEYIIQVSFHVSDPVSTWIVQRKYRDFCQLHESLVNQYPSVQFPPSSFQFAQKTINEFKRSSYSTSKMCGPGAGSSSFSSQVYQDAMSNSLSHNKPISQRSSANMLMAPGSGDQQQPKQAVPGSGGGTSGSNMITDRRNILQQYLQELLMIPAIKESNQLKEFLQIKQRHPEFYNATMDNFMHSMQTSSSKKSDSTFEKHSKGNFSQMVGLTGGGLNGSIDSFMNPAIDLQSLGIKRLESNMNIGQNHKSEFDCSSQSVMNKTQKSRDRLQDGTKQKMNLKQFTVSQRYKQVNEHSVDQQSEEVEQQRRGPSSSNPSSLVRRKSTDKKDPHLEELRKKHYHQQSGLVSKFQGQNQNLI